MNFKEWWQRWSGALIGLAMTAFGIIGLYRCPNDLGHSISETLIVAGLVTFTVDPFVKRRLIGEASKDIFRYLLGFDLPPAIRDASQAHLFNTTLYCEDIRIEVNVMPTGNHVVVQVTIVGSIVAIKDCEYHQGVACEASEQGKILAASIAQHRDSSQDYDLKTEDSLRLVPKSDEPMVSEWIGKTIKLRAKEKLSYRIQFEIRRARFDFFVHNFGAPVIGAIVRVSGSDDLEVTASKSSRCTGSEYTYDQVFLPGDHLQVRWQPKKP